MSLFQNNNWTKQHFRLSSGPRQWGDLSLTEELQLARGRRPNTNPPHSAKRAFLPCLPASFIWTAEKTGVGGQWPVTRDYKIHLAPSRFVTNSNLFSSIHILTLMRSLWQNRSYPHLYSEGNESPNCKFDSLLAWHTSSAWWKRWTCTIRST